uniref:Putative calcium signal-modulating cyclophilin ligand n=1 Tax=Hyalomma excavatum TaxID=257692 RepID=A0A131XIX4_9ACAR
MEDAAEQAGRRREIRRKKILENSDARWMKIMGQEKHRSQDAPKEASIPAQIPLTKQEQPLTSSETRGTSLGEQARLSYSLGDAASQFLSEDVSGTVGVSTVSGSRLSETRTRSLDETAAANGAPRLACSQRSASYSFPKKVSDTESRSYARCRSDTLGADEGTLGWLLELLGPCGPSLVRAWLLGLVATCTRLWLAMGAAALGGPQTILLPFCLLETALYSYHKFSPKPSISQRSARSTSAPLAFLATALVLCGISPKVSSRTTACLQLVSDVMVDLMVYTFTFVVFHVILDDWVG